VATNPTEANDLQNDGQIYEDLLEILEKYFDEEPVKTPFLIKNDVKVIL
jgi:hypothetical protein